MRIEHVAIWTTELERLREFYETHFGARAGPKYTNPVKRFESYFLRFPGGPRLELMRRTDVQARPAAPREMTGYAHLAFATGSEQEVDATTARLAAAGCPILDGPRRTGDGYYESVVLDPVGNRIEITV